MKIGVDGSFLVRDSRGMGRVTRALLNALLHFRHEFFFLTPLHAKDRPAISRQFSSFNINFLDSNDEKLKRLDLIWFPWGRVDLNLPVTKILTLHDMAQWRFPNSDRDLGYKERARITKSVSMADHIVTVSKFARSDISTFLEVERKDISVIYHGVDSIFRPATPDEKGNVQANFSDGAPYLFFVGSIEKRKNIETLLWGFDQFKKRYKTAHKLLISGDSPFIEKKRFIWEKPPKKNSLFFVYNSLEFKDDIKFLGHLTDDNLVRLYSNCDAFIFPSLYEGFGVPLLEAFASGVPVLAADIPVFREIAADAALYFYPHEPEDMAEQLQFLLSEKELAATLRGNGFERVKEFTWESAANKYMKIFEVINAK